MDLNDKPELSPYFPDGTLCHQDDSGSKYYCQRQMCLEENSRVAKSTEPDLDLFLNAVPGDEEGNETPEQLRTYFTLNDNLKPVGSQETGCTKELAELNAYTMFVTLKQEEDKTRSEIKSPLKTLCQTKTDSQTRKLFQLSMYYSRPAMT